MPVVGYDPDRLLVAGSASRDWFTYRVVGRHPGARRQGLEQARAAHPDEAYLQLPPPSADLETIAGRTRALLAGADTDLGRVRALERYFRGGFDYELEGRSWSGVRGIAQFLEARRGFCVHFASAAVLMLRSQGMPARAVTGMLVRDWSGAERRYEVRGKDMHAWIEVYFEGLGWVPFDMTPVAPGADVAAAQRQLVEPGLAVWGQDMLRGVRDWLADDVAGGELVTALVDAFPALARSVVRHPLAFLAYLATLFSLLLVWRLRRRAERPHAAARPRSEADQLYDRVLALLARRGYRKRAAQTPREFAEEVVRAGGDAFAPLVGITERFYAHRFGGRPFTRDERDRILGYLGRISRAG
jgi:hypothetical protein